MKPIRNRLAILEAHRVAFGRPSIIVNTQDEPIHELHARLVDAGRISATAGCMIVPKPVDDATWRARTKASQLALAAREAIWNALRRTVRLPKVEGGDS